MKAGIQLEFSLSQHSRDELLLKSLIEFFNCGKIQKYKDACYYRVSNLPGITSNIIPLFKIYPILGEKSKERFLRFLQSIRND